MNNPQVPPPQAPCGMFDWVAQGYATLIGEDADASYEYESDAVLAIAQSNYKTFYNLNAVPTVAMLAHTSAGITGWSNCSLKQTPDNEKDDLGNKRKLEACESMDSTDSSPLKSKSQRRKGDEEELRELQLVMLESLGVNVGNDAKKSLIQDMINPGTKKNDNESDSEEDWSVEDDGYNDNDEDASLDSVSIQSKSEASFDRNSRTGLSPLAADLFIGNSEESTSSDSAIGSFVVVKSGAAAKGEESSLCSSSSQEYEGTGETGLSPLAKGLTLGDSSEDDDQDSSTGSYVKLSPASQTNDENNDDWALL